MRPAALLLAALLLCPAHSAGAEARPNVIVVLADDFGWGDPSCYGNKLVKTPQLDRMAKQGIRFTQFYTASPICSPSRCGLLTGQFPARWRITSFLQTRAGNKACGQVDFLDPKAPSLPLALKEAGYATAHVGKWHLGGGRDVTDAPKFAAYGYDLGLGTWESPESASALGTNFPPWAEKLDPGQVERHDRTHWMVDQTLTFLKKHKGNKPCFVNLWLDDTHTPFRPSQKQLDAVKKIGDKPEAARYKAVLVEMDRQVGRLLDGLREQKQDRDTLVLFTGDNGPSQPLAAARTAGLRGMKLSLYEGGIRTPLIAHWPGRVPAGAVNETSVVAAVDLFPSLCKLCGAKLPKGMAPDGEDLSGALLGKKPSRTKSLFWEYGRVPGRGGKKAGPFAYPADPKMKSPNVAVRDGKWKLLINADGKGAELYDVLADSRETKDRAAAEPAVTKKLSNLALDWRKSLP